MATGVGLKTNFPNIPEEYDASFMRSLVEFLDELGRSAYLKDQHLDVDRGDNAGTREVYLMVRSPDGTPWALEVNNAGTLTPRDVSTELPS